MTKLQLRAGRFFFSTNWWCSGFSFPHLCTSSKIDRETEMASCGNWWNEKSWWHFRAVISNPVAGLSTPLLIDTRKPETLSIVFDKSCLCKHWLEVAENPPWDKQNRSVCSEEVHKRTFPRLSWPFSTRWDSTLSFSRCADFRMFKAGFSSARHTNCRQPTPTVPSGRLMFGDWSSRRLWLGRRKTSSLPRPINQNWECLGAYGLVVELLMVYDRG